MEGHLEWCPPAFRRGHIREQRLARCVFHFVPLSGVVVQRTGGHTPGHSVVRLASGGDRLTFAGDAVFQVGFEHPDWYNGFEHDPEEAARVRVSLLRELAANRESLVATHLSFPSVCHVAVAGDVFRWVPGPWEY